VAVNVKSKQQKAAETFVTWLGTNAKAQQVVADSLNDISSLKSVAPDWSSIKVVDQSTQEAALKTLIASTSNVSEARLGDVGTALGQAIGDALQAVGSGQQTPSAAMAQLQSSSGQ
jgi:ABC-type glycerol-3-phosphate transport system substrate-binding protein